MRKTPLIRPKPFFGRVRAVTLVCVLALLISSGAQVDAQVSRVPVEPRSVPANASNASRENGAPNAETLATRNDNSALSQPTASEIWSAFFFGRPGRKTGKPKFAFSFAPNESPRLYVPKEIVSEGDEGPSDVQRRIEELDRFLAAKANERARLAALEKSRAVDVQSASGDRLAELARLKQANVEIESIKTQKPNIDERVAAANRSKIRQTSAEEPSRKDRVSENSVEPRGLPVRPYALKISDRSYISTEMARLPKAAPLTRLPGERREQSESRDAPSFSRPKTGARTTSASTSRRAGAPSRVLRPQRDFIAPEDL